QTALSAGFDAEPVCRGGIASRRDGRRGERAERHVAPDAYASRRSAPAGTRPARPTTRRAPGGGRPRLVPRHGSPLQPAWIPADLCVAAAIELFVAHDARRWDLDPHRR